MDKYTFQHASENPDYTLSPFWFWNDTIEEAELTAQMRLMHAIHADQPVIHARHGLQLDYLSDTWFERVGQAIRFAEEQGMRVWLYDENNWPSGNCNGELTRDPENREHFLLIYHQELKEGDSLVIPADNQAVESSRLINATLRLPATGEERDLLKEFTPETLSSFAASEPCEIYLVKLAVNIYDPFGALAVDYLSHTAMERFLASTHERYYERFGDSFGKSIAGVFMDETRFLNALPWTNTFAEEFRRLKGYDIVPLTHLLLCDSDRSRYVRYDYFDVVATLLQNGTFRTINEWCQKHNLLFTGHVLGEESLATQSRFNADFMRVFRYMDVPGIDHLGNGIGSLNAKICASAAHNYGKTLVGSESFGACGWDMDSESLVRISNWLFQQGINHMLIHAFYYSIREERQNDWPPSYFTHWKHWDRMKDYTEMCARMCSVLQGTVNDTSLLVYYPVESFWTCYAPEFDTITCYFKEGPFIRNEQAAQIDHAFQYLCSSLLNANYDFEIFNSDAVDCMVVRDGCLVNRHTGAVYRTLVLPKVTLLPDAFAELLNEFVRAGGKVIAYDCPQIEVVGRAGEHLTHARPLPVLETAGYIPAATVEEVMQLCRTLVKRPFVVTQGVDELTRTQMAYPDRLHDPYLHDGEQQYGVGIVPFRKERERILNVTNFNEQDETLTLWMAAAKAPQLFVPETGEVEDCDAVQEDGGYRVTVTVPQNRSVFLIAPAKETATIAAEQEAWK